MIHDSASTPDNVYNECLQQQQQQLYLYPAVPYIDLHDTNKFDKYIERVQAAHMGLKYRSLFTGQSTGHHDRDK